MDGVYPGRIASKEGRRCKHNIKEQHAGEKANTKRARKKQCDIKSRRDGKEKFFTILTFSMKNFVGFREKTETSRIGYQRGGHKF
jgi:hypothetical protein